MNYTRGEWTVFRFSDFHNWKVRTGEDNWFIDCGIEENAEANANLIAAAPDMYEALKAIRDFLVEYRRTVNDPSSWPILNKMNEALAKAEGKGEK